MIPGLHVIVFTNPGVASEIARRECPRARIQTFDPGLMNLVERWKHRKARYSRAVDMPTSSCPANTLLKWEAVNPKHYLSVPKASNAARVVLYLDSDVDARWMTSLDALQRYEFHRKLGEFARDTSCRLRATPDHMAPVNTGIMLLKPSMSMYREGLALLRTRTFDLQSGFNHTGPPKLALNATVSGQPGLPAQPLVMKARGYWKDTWDFVCGDGDQGMFTTMYMARHQQFCVPKYWDKELRVQVRRRPLGVCVEWSGCSGGLPEGACSRNSHSLAPPSDCCSQHFWGGDKPWYNPPTCAQYFAFLSGPQAVGKFNRTRVRGAESCAAYLHRQGQRARRGCNGRTWPLI